MNRIQNKESYNNKKSRAKIDKQNQEENNKTKASRKCPACPVLASLSAIFTCA
jgi:hypothetical protein